LSKPIPYLFCRYQIGVDDQALDQNGQQHALQNLQGNEIQHGRSRQGQPPPAALVMAPDSFDVDGTNCLAWLIGIQPGFRVQNNYDKKEQKIRTQVIDDPHIKFAPVIALPSVGAMALEDRSSDERITARQALGAFKTILRLLGDEGGTLTVHHGNADDIQRWLSKWEISEYSYIIAPLNPITASDLANRRSDAIKKENIIRETGKVTPPKGQSLHQNGGSIEEANDLSSVGYGRQGF
jgi:hypothetical protein